MKNILAIVTILFSQTAGAQKSLSSQPDTTQKLIRAEAACGLCQFGLRGHECALAVRIDGKSYWADGADIDGYGDAHAKDGFCQTIRKAEFQGAVVSGRYRLTYFKPLPAAVSSH